jgi:hypothetical protein
VIGVASLSAEKILVLVIGNIPSNLIAFIFGFYSIISTVLFVSSFNWKNEDLDMFVVKLVVF